MNLHVSTSQEEMIRPSMDQGSGNLTNYGFISLFASKNISVFQRLRIINWNLSDNGAALNKISVWHRIENNYIIETLSDSRPYQTLAW